MTQYVLPVIFTLGLWWLSTGVVLIVVNRKRATYRWSMLAASVVLAGALFGLAWSSAEASLLNVYLAFLCGVLIWGWNETAYFMGLITGPRPRACPPAVGAWRRFWLAIQTSLYHELCIIAFAAALITLTWDAPNRVGMWAFVILWLMRWSAKLNIFFGVPNINLHFFPDHLRYLESFIVRQPINLFFPASMAVACVIAAHVLDGAILPSGGPVDVAASLLLGSLMLLAILEHGFMILPLRDAALWRWAVPSEQAAAPGDDRPAAADACAPPAPDETLRFSHQPFDGFDRVPSCGSPSPRPAITTSGR